MREEIAKAINEKYGPVIYAYAMTDYDALYVGFGPFAATVRVDDALCAFYITADVYHFEDTLPDTPEAAARKIVSAISSMGE